MTRTTYFPWHHLMIGLVTNDGVPIRAVVYGERWPVGASFPSPEGWSECPGVSKNLPKVLEKIEKLITNGGKDGR